ncbi:hypothetical protein [Kitasatospora griseola]|uniref:hypothetical protein n=1 Tax=Kitasatospora griseola TaxID=2064 RepID=UPI00381CA60C
MTTGQELSRDGSGPWDSSASGATPPERHRHPVVLDSGRAALIEAELAGRRERLAVDLL